MKEKDIISNTFEKTVEATHIAGVLLLPVAGAHFKTSREIAIREFHHQRRKRAQRGK